MTLRTYVILLGLLVAGLCALDAVHADVPTPVKHKKTATVLKKKTSKTKKSKTSAKARKSAKTAAAGKVSSPKATSGELQTDVKFDDSVLHGQYQTPEEALARVEDEKGLSDLLGVRKHFKDRLATASEQE